MKDGKQEQQAMRLAVATKRLRSRLREVASVSSSGLPISQLAIIQRLRAEGPATASALAAFEHVSQQAIAQTVAALKRKGLVKTAPDKADRRKTVISMTQTGINLFESAKASRTAWLVRAINATVSKREESALDDAIKLLERLAEADVKNI